MKKIIIIKYGELNTKKDNISFFINMLKDNIKDALSDIENKINYDQGRMFLYPEDFEETIKRLKKVFGIHEINIGYEINNTDYDEISSNLISLLKDKNFNTFKVISRRSDKSYPLNSMELNRRLGSHILKNIKDIKVNVHHPELEINVEIRSKKSYLYFEKIKGLGGYPIGTLGKGMLMLSGGIDSPVAGYLALKRGIRLEAVYFESPPHTSENAKNKVLDLARILTNYSGYLKVHIVNFTEIQEAIYRNCKEEYMITIMRRMMYRISERLSYQTKSKVIINGESIGQVASQTLTSMGVINEVVTIPVIRPLACFDKSEIIKIAKEIDSYEISIKPYEDCCTIFVPKHPVINPISDIAEENEALIPYYELIDKAIKNTITIKIERENKDFINIL